MHSAVWKFNFTEGNFGGWIIIPSNLDVGNTFFDATKPGNVTVEGEEQKIVAGASRTITHACDSKRIIKEWDKATGVYTYAVERPKNITIITTAVATNMWSPQIQQVNQTMFNTLVAACIGLAVLTLSLVTVITRKKTIKRPTLSHASQGKIVALTIVMVLLFEVVTIFVFPFMRLV